MLPQEVQKICATQQGKWLARSKSVGVRPIVSSGYQYSLVRTFVKDRAVQISNRRHPDCPGVSFRLDDDLATANWIWVESNGIHSPVPTGLRHFHFPTARGEDLPKDLSDQVFELFPRHCSQICATLLIKINLARFHKTLVAPVEAKDSWDRCHACKR